jgi:acetamidase/formamidase
VAEHSLSAEPIHSRWNRDLRPRLVIAPGDTVYMECQDASGLQVRPAMTLAEYQTINRDRIHALTGPIFIDGAEPGDVLQIDILEVAHKGWGWSSIIPGLGFLKDRFAEWYLFHWQLEGEVSRSLAPAVVPLRPFCGVMGVAPGEPGEFRTQPPGPFGGNMDVRELCSGARLYLPVLNRGALFSAGDAHAAQGDGEVCINGIECTSDATLRFHLHRQQSLTSPIAESPAARERTLESDAWIVIESSTNAISAARAATGRMIDLLVARWGFKDVHAYVLCSAAMNLHFAQVVNEPMITATASIAKSVLPLRELF